MFGSWASNESSFCSLHRQHSRTPGGCEECLPHRCHGINVVAGPLPDLRYATKATHEGFENIVLEGEKEPLGMPSFKELLKPEQVRSIQAYILKRAAESSKR